MENTVKLSFEPHVPLHSESRMGYGLRGFSAEHPNLNPPAWEHLVYLSVPYCCAQGEEALL